MKLVVFMSHLAVRSCAPVKSAYCSRCCAALGRGYAHKRVYSIHQNDSKNYALTKDQFVAHIENQDNGFDFDFSAYRLILGIIEKIVAEADRKNLGQ